MKNTYFVILSGGKGERLWPLSRRSRPKQFLSFLDQRSLLEHTVDRISSIASDKNSVGVVTIKTQSENVLKMVKDKIGFVFEEPAARNTAPAIAFSCLSLEKMDKDSIVVFLPADSFVIQDDKYRDYLSKAIEYAICYDKIVTLGVMPTKPATGYGYIQANCGHDLQMECGSFYDVFRFHEKPDLSLAKKYMHQGDMLWNISVFVGKISVFLKEFQVHAPQILDSVNNFFKGEAQYSEIENISIDYAVMEKSKNIVVLPCDFEWTDVGNLDVFLTLQKKLSKKDLSKIINIEAEKNLAYISSDKPKNEKIIVFVGLSDVCLIEDNDVVLVVKRSEVDKVKKVLSKIQEQALEKFL